MKWVKNVKGKGGQANYRKNLDKVVLVLPPEYRLRHLDYHRRLIEVYCGRNRGFKISKIESNDTIGSAFCSCFESHLT
jgi:hypothetical protein